MVGLGTLVAPVNAEINNDKIMTGSGIPILSPTIGVITDGTLVVNNNEYGVIDTNSQLPFADIVNALTGDDITVNNTGYMNGAMGLVSSWRRHRHQQWRRHDFMMARNSGTLLA